MVKYAGTTWDELKHIRQAVGFLCLTYNSYTKSAPCNGMTHTGPTVFHQKVMMTEDSKIAVNSSFWLDDDSNIPFSVDDISKSMPQVDIGEPPPLICKNSATISNFNAPGVPIADMEFLDLCSGEQEALLLLKEETKVADFGHEYVEFVMHKLVEEELTLVNASSSREVARRKAIWRLSKEKLLIEFTELGPEGPQS
uniref:Uncharacterized protein n=1 Tax=Lactuca sativa TaxID=4236 RepID=A0A9R1W924_LACSA|nr:hypothetical protein LSAT_V11C200069940 [Lactuca sativa]